MDWILVTGQPTCGKTTCVKAMVNFLLQRGVYCKGFYTEEVKAKGGSRTGFDIVTIPDGKRGVLSRKEGLKSKFKTGQYFVDVASFEALAIPSLTKKDEEEKERTVFVLDEIGRMELHSVIFQEHVRNMMRDELLLVGAVTAPRYGHRVPFCDEITALDSVEVRNLTKSNRDEVTDEILKLIEERWSKIFNDSAEV